MVALRSQGNWRWEGPLGTPLGLVHWKDPLGKTLIPGQIVGPAEDEMIVGWHC